MKKLLLFIALISLFSCQKEETELNVSISQVVQQVGKLEFTATVIKGELPVTIFVNINNGNTNVLSEGVVVTTHNPIPISLVNKWITTESGVFVYISNRLSTGIKVIKL